MTNRDFQNHASQALDLAAKEIERLEGIVLQSEKYFAFFLLGSGSVRVKYRATPSFVKAVRSGSVGIIQNLIENGYEFVLGVRDGNEFRPMTEDERLGFLIND